MDQTRILLVESSTKMGLTLKAFLEERGYKVEWVWDAGEAIEVLEARVPSIAITDANLPGFDGIFLARLIKAHPHYRGVAVITIEAGTAAIEQQALEAGCIACFRTPLDRERLLGLVRDLAPAWPLPASA